MADSFYHEQFIHAVNQCRRLMVDQAIECYLADPAQLAMESDTFFDEVQDRFNCLGIMRWRIA